MKALLITLIFLAIFAPIYIIKMDYKTSSHIKPVLEITSIEAAEPIPITEKHTVISVHFNIVEETPTPTLIPTAMPTIEATPTIIPTIEPTVDPISNLHTPYLLDRNEAQTFMEYDQTDKIPYSEGFKCGSYAHTVIDNAWSFGIVARYTIVLGDELGSNGHAIVCFPTLEGNVYVDATAGDWWAYPTDTTFHTVSMLDPNYYGFAPMNIDGFATYQEYGK